MRELNQPDVLPDRARKPARCRKTLLTIHFSALAREPGGMLRSQDSSIVCGQANWANFTCDNHCDSELRQLRKMGSFPRVDWFGIGLEERRNARRLTARAVLPQSALPPLLSRRVFGRWD